MKVEGTKTGEFVTSNQNERAWTGLILLGRWTFRLHKKEGNVLTRGTNFSLAQRNVVHGFRYLGDQLRSCRPQ